MGETVELMTEVTFEPPGPGAWELEATHHGHRPVSMYVRETLRHDVADGFKALVERYGLPLEGVRVEYVNGCAYMRPVGLGEGSKPKPPPPVLIMKLIARLHPEMRRRNRAAEQAWRDKLWRTEVDRWFDHDRGETVARNRELQGVDLTQLDDSDLAAHLSELLTHFADQARLNLDTHGGDFMPTGDYLAHCGEWMIDFGEATALLTGSSPATVETAELLAPVARALKTAGARPASVDEVRQLGPHARQAVDTWLELHAWRLVTSDDVDKPTLAERPALQLAALLAATGDAEAATDSPDPSAVRTKVPEAQRPLFDELLSEARYGMRQRDDIVGVRWNWSGGLLRRGLLEAGSRLVRAGLLERADHSVELEPAELEQLLVQRTGPSPADIAARAAERDRVEASNPPAMLGEPEPPPPLEALPTPMARATAAMMAMLEAEGLASQEDDDPLSGTGIGNETYTGVARVATSADDALERLSPGDILVAPFTGPSYNSVIPLLGALVVELGGSMCHAAIVAREFGLSAVIGASGATTAIPDGATVEVDPIEGIVRVIA
jgi:phosphohistidine swiveling domain-containing protein